ncbi:MAG: hypothetical protein AAF389_02650 [Gemmatimonadota bacterium]
MMSALRSRVVGLVGGFGLMLVGLQPVAGQEYPGLLEVVEYYHEHATSDLRHIQEATKRFEALAVAHPPDDTDEHSWLPSYWTAFAYTQLSLFSDDDRAAPFVDLARVYFEMATRVKPEGDPGVDADFYALEGLILSFVSRTMPDDPDSGRERAVWNQARAADAQNPMMLMNGGLALIANPQTREQAYELLDLAIEFYEPRLGTVRPNWGREFIDVWTGSYPRGEW